MRRILVDEKFHDSVNIFYTKFLEQLTAKPKNKLKNLKSVWDNSTCLGKYESEYIQAIIDKYEEIVIAKPVEIIQLVQDFNLILHSTKISKEFHESITNALRYTTLREKLLPFYQNIKLKSCVYCNAQLTIVIDREVDQSGRFELDHFYPKSQFPFLAASFYNLIPCCSNCNKAKLDKKTLFNLYTEEQSDLSVFGFILTDDSKDKYLLTKDHTDLIVKFIHLNGDNEMLENHKSHFYIEELYETQKDILENLTTLSQVYNDDSKAELVDSFKELFPDKAMINRLIIGNYDSPEDIHLRPLAKFTQDIARELKLI
ncbi:MAG: hypothetical protein RLZZ175_3138 [Bacteroidota bacterium]|jgi:5-methylcytosine-specific restriction endonuclease McrA